MTRALTGEVKIQGNFGELKLKQLLEDLGLKDGEQYSSQEHLRDKLGNQIKDDEGKGLIPDFILHFPNKRDVVVDSKMSFTAYERYINTNDPNEQSSHLKDHLVSLRAQVDRLAKKDYSKYLREGYNKLNFVIMYIHTEGALNLALSNDSSLWREAYDKGVLILGPQTMYMNLRILEMMWTQVRQLKNQEDMMKAAHQIIDRTQDFAKRFSDVETKMKDTVSCMNQLRITIVHESTENHYGREWTQHHHGSTQSHQGRRTREQEKEVTRGLRDIRFLGGGRRRKIGRQDHLLSFFNH